MSPPESGQAAPVASVASAPLSTLAKVDLAGRVVIALLFTPIFAFVCLFVEHTPLLAVSFLTLLIVAFLGSGANLLEKYPLLGRIKLLGGVLRVTGDLDTFYREHPPRTILYYLVYPLYALVGVFVSKVIRREIVLHLKVLLIVIVTLLFEVLATYGRTYPPYLEMSDAATIIGVQLIQLFFVALLYLMPTLSTVYALSRGGHTKTLRGLTLASMLLAAPMVYLAHKLTSEMVPPTEQMRLGRRFAKEKFRDDLGDLADMFLGFEIAQGRIEPDGPMPRTDKMATKAFRKLASSLMPAIESRGFSVFAFNAPAVPKDAPKDARMAPDVRLGVWTGVRVVFGTKALLLYLRSPDGKLITKISEAPKFVLQRFKIGTTTTDGDNARYLAAGIMIGDMK